MSYQRDPYGQPIRGPGLTLSDSTLGTMSRHGSGIPIASLPKTIQDAITVTRHIGMNLLWVDSLCITQDDPEELDLEIANMAAYYKNSQLTIVAAIARSCSQGFLEANSSLSSEGFEFPFSSGDTANAGRIKLSKLGGPTSQVIDTRAWTLQEGLLSTRIASFSIDTIAWSCQSDDYGKALMIELRKALRNSKSGSRLTLRDWRKVPDRLDNKSFRAHIISHFQDAWHEIVCRYCDRHLSEEVDGLVAISGIASEFASSLWPATSDSGPSKRADQPNYVAGLWDSALLPLQLLWRPRTFAPRPLSTVFVAPSWSWASARAPLDRNEETYKMWLTKARFSGFQVLNYDLELRN